MQTAILEAHPHSTLVVTSRERRLSAADKFRNLLASKGFVVSEWASLMLDRAEFSGEARQESPEVILLSVAELGYPAGADLQDLYDNASRQGLALCPPDLGPLLCLRSNSLPWNERVHIAMRPITIPEAGPQLFGVEVGRSGRWLVSGKGDLDGFWHQSSRLIFLDTRKSM